LAFKLVAEVVDLDGLCNINGDLGSDAKAVIGVVTTRKDKIEAMHFIIVRASLLVGNYCMLLND